MRRVLILGSTGSIGTQALDVIRERRDQFEVRRVVIELTETEPLARPGQCHPEAFTIERLEQVVHRMQFEGADGVAVVRGHEDHRGTPSRRQGGEHRESIEAGHLDIEEEQIDRRLVQSVHRLQRAPIFPFQL